MAAESPNRRFLLIAIGVLVLLACGFGAAVAGLNYLREPDSESTEPTTTEPTVAYILDVSPRMGPTAEREDRLQIARGILADILRRADPELTAGLRDFGTDREGTADCEDTVLVVPFAKGNRSRVATGFSELELGASSESALGEAMFTAIQDLRDEAGSRHMVVVTGGPDSCNPNAGPAVAEEAQRAGIDLQTFVIGFQVSPQDSETLRRMAEQIGGGMYFDAADADELRRVLESIQRLIEQGDPIDLGEVVAATSAPEEEESEGEQQPDVPTGDALDYDPQTACDHPYFPLRTGAHWDYSYDGTPASWDVVDVSGDLNSATATVVVKADPLTITYNWDCGADGVFYYQTGLFDFSEIGENVEMVLTSQSGSPLPPAEGLQPGSSWNSAYTMEIRMEAEGVSFVITNDVEETHTAGAIEERITAAGTFEVIPVTISRTTITSMPGSSFTNTSSGTCWFALRIGWLGCEESSVGETSVSELVSFSIP